MLHLLWALFLLATGTQGVDQFQLASAFVDDEVVSANTNLNFEFSIARASKSSVQTNDYLDLVLPAGTSARWDTPRRPPAP